MENGHKITSNSLKNASRWPFYAFWQKNIEITNFAKVRYLCRNRENELNRYFDLTLYIILYGASRVRKICPIISNPPGKHIHRCTGINNHKQRLFPTIPDVGKRPRGVLLEYLQKIFNFSRKIILNLSPDSQFRSFFISH